jgi:hypothetical protein
MTTTIMKSACLASMSLALAFGLAACDRPRVPWPHLAPGQPVEVEGTDVAAALVSAPAQLQFAAATTCNMEHLDGKPFEGAPVTVKAGKDFTVAGFVFNQAQESIPDDVLLRMVSDSASTQEAWEGPIKGRVKRPDVAGYFHLDQWAAGAGYEQLFSTKGLPSGSYHLMITFADGAQRRICDNGRHLLIAP